MAQNTHRHSCSGPHLPPPPHTHTQPITGHSTAPASSLLLLLVLLLLELLLLLLLQLLQLLLQFEQWVVAAAAKQAALHAQLLQQIITLTQHLSLLCSQENNSGVAALNAGVALAQMCWQVPRILLSTSVSVLLPACLLRRGALQHGKKPRRSPVRLRQCHCDSRDGGMRSRTVPLASTSTPCHLGRLPSRLDAPAPLLLPSQPCPAWFELDKRQTRCQAPAATHVHTI